MLHEAKVESTKPRGRPSLATKLVGHNVCNNCYVDAIGYLQQQFKYLKRFILTDGRSSGQHGNSDRNRELLHVAACRAVMEVSGIWWGCVSCPSHNLSGNGRAATSRDTGVTNRDLGASREATRG